MKRLLRIAINSAIFSFIPILSWFCLGLLVDKNNSNSDIYKKQNNYYNSNITININLYFNSYNKTVQKI